MPSWFNLGNTADTDNALKEHEKQIKPSTRNRKKIRKSMKSLM